jgi:hypothetical protein
MTEIEGIEARLVALTPLPNAAGWIAKVQATDDRGHFAATAEFFTAEWIDEGTPIRMTLTIGDRT